METRKLPEIFTQDILIFTGKKKRWLKDRPMHINKDADRYSMANAAEADFKEEQVRMQENMVREENERIVMENQNIKQQIETCRKSELDAPLMANDVLQKISQLQVET